MSYTVTKNRIVQWLGIILIIGVFAGAYWYFQVYGSTITQSQNGLITNGLVGYWSFNTSDIDGTTAYDRSGNSNNGTLTSGPTGVDGEIDQALSFNGTTQYVDIPDIVMTGTFSYSFWYKTSNNAQTGIMLGGDVNNGTYVKYGLVSNNLYIRVISGGSSDNTISPGTANVWHHLVITRDSSNKIDLYLDGGSANRLFSDAAQSGSTSLTHVAKSQDGQFFAGQMDEVRMYNRILSSDEIQTLYTQRGVGKTNSAVSQPQGTGRLDSGLAGYWKLDGRRPTVIATDSSTNANTGTLTNGPTWTTGQIGGALDFDGTNDYVSAGSPTVLDDMGPITVSGWVNADTMGTTRIINKSGAGFASGWIFRLCNSDGANCPSTGNTLNFAAGFSGLAGRWYAPANSINTGQWIFVAVSYDRSSLSNDPVFYVNGAKVTTTEAATPSGTYLSDASASLHIGADSDGTSGFDGKIDEVRIYNRILSSDEVSQLYRLTTPTSVDTGLKGYWSFNAPDMNGTSAYDRSGAGNTGTLTGGPTRTIGKIGQALNMVAASSYVTIPDSASLSPTAAFTLSFWIRPTATVTGSEKTLVLKSETSQRTFHVQSTSAGAVKFNVASSIGDSGSNYGVSPDGVIVQNQWTHVTTVFDGAGSGNSGRAKIYINGVEQPVTYTGTIAATVPNATSPLVFGSLLTATYDEARFYSRALSAAEIKGLYDVGADDKVNSAASQPQGTGRLDSGLTGYWKLDDGSGTSATDASTNANTGTLTSGPTWTTGQIGGAVDFDGTDDYIAMGDPASGVLDIVDSTNFTLSGWFNRDTFTTDDAIVSKRLGVASGNSGYIVYIDDATDKLTFEVSDGTDEYQLESVSTFTATGWHHYTIVWDDSGSGQTKLYINGASEAATATGTFANVNSLANSVSFLAGLYLDGVDTPTLPFDGKLDDIRVYSRALSAGEVAQLYRLNAPTGIDTGLKGYWSFNGPDMLSSTTAADRSGAGNTGTLTGGPARAIGKIGQALRFDMVDDYVNAGSATSLDDLGPLSISVWINPNSIGEGGSLGKIIGKNGSVSDGSWQFSLVSTTPCVSGGTPTQTNSLFFTKVGTGSNVRAIRCAADNTVVFNEWQHYVVTWDGSTGYNNTGIHIYKNGTEVSYVTTNTAAIAGAASDAALDLIIGNRAAADRTFDGEIDEVRIYNRVLTAAEAAALYNQSR